jgi:CBS domain-containing protein
MLRPTSPLARPVGRLLSRPLVACSTDLTVRDAARRMADEDTASIVSLDAAGRPRGIVTDSDLRRRVLSADLDPAVPLARIMSAPVLTIQHDAPAALAVQTMLEQGVHHLVVVDVAGVALGVLADSDLMAAEVDQPLFLARRIERARGMPDLAAARTAFPGAVRLLLDGGVAADVITRILAEAHDRLTRRLLELALAELGPPPCAFCWVVMGSEGRRDQTLHTDQDNGLIYVNGVPPETDAYFSRLADWMVRGLEACGAPPCRGGVMATNRAWRGSLDTWRTRFRSWLALTDPDALLRALIGFDFRPAGGSTSLAEELRSWLTAHASSAHPFLARLAQLVSEHRPVIGLLGRFQVARRGPDKGTLDLKLQGTRPIVDGARLLALENRIPAVDTLERLDGARAASALGGEDTQDVQNAFIALQKLRLRAQLAALQAGREPDNRLAPGKLPRAERTGLREHLRSATRLRDTVVLRFEGQLRTL